jgi:hypothetical protein
MHRSRTALLLLVMTTLLAGLIITPASAATPRKMALGVTRGNDRSIEQYQEFVDASGRAPAIWGISAVWGASNRTFPDLAFLSQLSPDTVPMIWWQPVDPAHVNSSKYRYTTIIGGKHDAYIRAFAKAAKAYGKPVLIRFAQEFDGFWFPWSVSWFTNTPKRFKLAWRHIWQIFRSEGATNAKFIWSPNKVFPKAYPGDKYVDYVAFSAFNWSTQKRPWRSLPRLVEKAMKDMTAFTRKPIILAETGTAPTGGNKPAWIKNGYQAVYTRWKRLKAIVYFDVDGVSLAGHPDWRLNSPESAMDAYRSLLDQTIFQGRIN